MTLDELKATFDNATPGKWQQEHRKLWTVEGNCMAQFEDPADAKLCSNMKALLPSIMCLIAHNAKFEGGMPAGIWLDELEHICRDINTKLAEQP